MQIIAAHVNGALCPGEIEKELAELGTPTQPFDKIKYMLSTINAKADLFNTYKVNSIYDMKLASVESKYQGKNLGKDALKLDEKIARENGFEVFH